jgi:DNA-directed RNA polymerase subunit RPC12/RpoP
MNNIKNNETIQEVVSRLDSLFMAFNKKLFNGELETPVITVAPNTPNGKRTGWCTKHKAWQGEEERYEINMCAEHLNRPFLDICETLIHEMVHLRNLQFGIVDCSRGGTYHNKRFGEYAEMFGLTVEKGKGGWNVTKLTEKTAEWLKSEYPNEKAFMIYRPKKPTIKKASNNIKYICPNCGINFMTIKKLDVTCTKCEVAFIREEVKKQFWKVIES